MVHTFRQLTGSLYRQYSGALLTYLARRLPRPEDADDLAQEVFMRLLRVKETTLVLQPHKYIFGIASHVVREFYMNRESEPETNVETLDVAISDQDMLDQLSAIQQLEKALGKLSPMHQAVVLCLKRDGCTYEETAKITGLTYFTVEKYFFEAKARLKTFKWDR